VIAFNQGNVQALENGGYFIGWGQSPYFSEFGRGGDTTHAILDVKMPGDNCSYRAYRQGWIGAPDYPPSIAVRSSGAKHIVYASWNGSTETKVWQVMSGKQPGRLAPASTEPRTGFETAITLSETGPYFQARALDRDGNVIGVSRISKAE
jgi:hypothetical protein